MTSSRTDSFATLQRLACVLLFLTLLDLPQSVCSFATRRSPMTMKRGRGSFQKEVGGSDKGVQPSSPETSSISTVGTSSKRWIPVQGLKSAKDLPKEQGKVVLVDTMAHALVNGATNPTGAVSVVNYGDKTYCCSSSCPACKIPLTKAKILEASPETKTAPRMCCDFCSVTYNLQTGEKVESAGNSGILGGIVKGLLSAQDSGPLPVYELGEQKGKIVISL